MQSRFSPDRTVVIHFDPKGITCAGLDMFAESQRMAPTPDVLDGYDLVPIHFGVGKNRYEGRAAVWHFQTAEQCQGYVARLTGDDAQRVNKWARGVRIETKPTLKWLAKHCPPIVLG